MLYFHLTRKQVKQDERAYTMKHRTGHLYKRGNVFWLQYRIEGRTVQQSLGTANADEAEAKRKAIMRPYLAADLASAHAVAESRLRTAESTAQAAIEEATPPMPFVRAWDAYLAAAGRPDSGERTLADYQGYFAAFAAWMKETHPEAPALRDVTPAIASEYAAHLAGERKLSGNSFNKRIRFLELLYRVLKEPARLTVNSWESVKRKRQLPQGRRELTIDELRRLCVGATGEMRPLLAIGIYTGLRLGDAATLRWGEVDLVRRIIVRVPNKTATWNPKPIHIPMHPALRAILKELPKDGKGDYLLPETAALYRDNRPLLSNRIQELFEASGIRTTKPGTGMIPNPDKNAKVKFIHSGKRAVVEVGFHSLRHSFVSLCREAHAPLSVVESIVGHSNPAMTRLYSHTSEQAAGAAVNLLPAVLGDAPAPALAPVKMIDAAPIRALAESLTGKNWREVKAEILALTR
jgi:integrase